MRNSSQNRVLSEVLDGLMRRYQERVPNVGLILAAMQAQGLIRSPADVENDHIAFRTLGVPQLGIASLEKIFVGLGYQRRDAYSFPGKKLNAYWYAPPADHFPRIFISELRVNELTQAARKIIRSYTDEVTSDPVDGLDLESSDQVDHFLHTGLWRTPSWDDYSLLAEESEYAAWAIYNRYYLNHFTISVHNLPEPYSTVAQFNQFVESLGIQLNDSGGKIKSSPDGLLLQSSTVAEMVDAEFIDVAGKTEVHQIPGSYVEFAERRILPQYKTLPIDQLGRQHRRDGFEAGNADKIFESTYRAQTKRN